MLRAEYRKYLLKFSFPARTSRMVMHDKPTYFLKVWDDADPSVYGVGECPLFPGLSPEDNPYYEKILDKACATINAVDVKLLMGWSSIRFGIETAIRDLQAGGRRVVFDTPWAAGDSTITINGLIWMGSHDEMLERIRQKLDSGFRCLKLKIGGIEFESELSLLESIRREFSPDELELRLDANGAFTPENAQERLERLARYHIHSIEQPIAPRQWLEMARLCNESPIPIALDEELIGVHLPGAKRTLLETIRPRYIILKPALCGGITGALEWVSLAQELEIGWWLTSALESNVGLNAIAQLASSLEVAIPQGLGTGGLYLNNIPSPIRQRHDYLCYDPQLSWDLSPIGF